MDILELMETRRTFRRFDQSRAIPQEVIEAMRQAIRYSSTGRNGQDMYYIFVQDPALVEAVFPYTHYAAALPPEEGQPKEGEHPRLFVVLLEKSPKHSPIDDVNAGIGMANISAVAWASGVGSVILRNINKPGIGEVLGIPAERINTVVAFGYPTHKVHLVEVPADGNLNYYLDENRDYVVPKKAIEETSEIR